MSGVIWGRFFWSDWANDPKLKLCSLAGQGLWMRLLCVMAESDPVGFLTVNGVACNDEKLLARLVGAEAAEVACLILELENNGVFSRRHGDKAIYSRRMVRDSQRHEKAVKGGRKGGKSSRDNQRGIFDSSEDTSDDTSASTPEPTSHHTSPPSSPPASWDTLAPSFERKLGPMVLTTARSKLENNNLAQRPNRRATEPGQAAPAGFDHERLIDQLCEASGIDRNQAASTPALLDASPIRNLLDAGYDLELDVLPALRRARRPGVGSWSYFVAAIQDARAKRAAVAPAPAAKPAGVDWDARVAHYRKTGDWPEAIFGMRMAGQVPQAVLAELDEIDANRPPSPGVTIAGGKSAA